MTNFTDTERRQERNFASGREARERRARQERQMARGAMEVTEMGNDELEIVGCRIPALAQQLANRRALRLADYPLARASEWSPLPAGAIPFTPDEGEDLSE